MFERPTLRDLAHSARFLVSFVGWATVALALSPMHPFTLVALPGLAAATLHARAPRATVLVELISLAAAVPFVYDAATTTFVVGGTIVVCAVLGAVALDRTAGRG